MARFKIKSYTREQSERDPHIILHKFEGNIRQPTIVEANNYLVDAYPHYSINGIPVWAHGDYGEYWLDPDEWKTLVLYEYDDFGMHCPICGHERDMCGSKGPVCLRPGE